MDLLRHLRPQQSEAAAEGRVIGRGIRVESCEASVHQVGPDFSLQFPERPPFEVLNYAAAKQAVWRDAGASRMWRERPPGGQPLANEAHELWVVEQGADGIEQVVLEEDGLPPEGHVEQG